MKKKILIAFLLIALSAVLGHLTWIKEQLMGAPQPPVAVETQAVITTEKKMSTALEDAAIAQKVMQEHSNSSEKMELLIKERDKLLKVMQEEMQEAQKLQKLLEKK